MYQLVQKDLHTTDRRPRRSARSVATAFWIITRHSASPMGYEYGPWICPRYSAISWILAVLSACMQPPNWVIGLVSLKLEVEKSIFGEIPITFLN